MDIIQRMSEQCYAKPVLRNVWLNCLERSVSRNWKQIEQQVKNELSEKILIAYCDPILFGNVDGQVTDGIAHCNAFQIAQRG